MADRGTVHRRAADEDDILAHGIMPSHGISINVPHTSPAAARPQPVKHVSAPTYQSPLRHHRRTPSRSKGVKETLNARSHYGSSEDDGGAIHKINQYVIKQEIGRGSFGAVHLAVDQYGNEYAVKEFSKSRLRKRAQSGLLRRPNQGRRPGHLVAGKSFNSPLHRLSATSSLDQSNNPLDLIKEEIAIMKKLDHHNLVSLIEVLDDPQEDSLYMVLEMCKKGVVMKVGLEERAEPYEDEACRCWFRDMILGIEYLHAQGIIHRDIKPDNCLITNDGVLKIVDFGVSEMFEKASDMATTKSAGSPAFMPPELCVAKHGQVSGRAADIWSMGVTLYCLRYGHIPFEKTGVLELYESIRSDPLVIEGEKDENFHDLMVRILEKNPDKRITMEELREHPWVTQSGTDPMMPTEYNCAELVEPPTEQEMNHAITGNMEHLMVVMKAVRRFKDLLLRKRPNMFEGIFGRNSRIMAPPKSIDQPRTSRSVAVHERRPVETALVVEGVHRDIDANLEMQKAPVEMGGQLNRSPPPTTTGSQGISETHVALMTQPSDMSNALDSEADFEVQTPLSRLGKARTFPVDDMAKGHAHDPLMDTLYLNIGTGDDSDPTAAGSNETPIVSESPGGVEENIYETAYQEEMRRIISEKNNANIHLTRRVDHREDIRNHPNIVGTSINHGINFARASAREAAKWLDSDHDTAVHRGASSLAALVQQASAEAKAKAKSSDTNPLKMAYAKSRLSTIMGGTIDNEEQIPTSERSAGGVESDTVLGGTIDDEDHVPTNEKDAGGVDSTQPPRKLVKAAVGRVADGVSSKLAKTSLSSIVTAGGGAGQADSTTEGLTTKVQSAS